VRASPGSPRRFEATGGGRRFKGDFVDLDVVLGKHLLVNIS
jgi:hypothetical protein